MSKTDEDKAAVLKAIADMPDEDRVIAERLHEIILENAPGLMPRTWYGMPAYTNGAKIVCFVRARKKFGERFLTLGFNDVAKLDEGTMWATNFGITTLTPADEKTVAELVRKAVQ